MIVYVSIGNSDDKLTQREWAQFVTDTGAVLSPGLSRRPALTRHGFWLSPADQPWQNACWCIEIEPDRADRLKAALQELARQHRQDSIAWAEVRQTEWLGPEPDPTPGQRSKWAT